MGTVDQQLHTARQTTYKAVKIAKELGMIYAGNPHSASKDVYAELWRARRHLLKDERKRTIQLKFENGRIYVIGYYPKNTRGQSMISRVDKQPEISMTQKKSAHAIAREILRRFYREYIEIYDKLLEASQIERQEAEWAAQAADLLTKTVGAHINSHTTPGIDTTLKMHVGSFPATGTIRINGHSRTVSIERMSSLDIETVIDLLQSAETQRQTAPQRPPHSRHASINANHHRHL